FRSAPREFPRLCCRGRWTHSANGRRRPGRPWPAARRRSRRRSRRLLNGALTRSARISPMCVIRFPASQRAGWRRCWPASAVYLPCPAAISAPARTIICASPSPMSARRFSPGSARVSPARTRSASTWQRHQTERTTMDKAKLESLRQRFGGDSAATIYDPVFAGVAERLFDKKGTRVAPYAGVPTLLDAPYRPIEWAKPDLSGLDVALLGVPMDLGITNRNGCRFGPRALRAIERVGPFHHVLKCMPTRDLAVADIGDVPFRSRFDLERSHEDIEQTIATIIAAGVVPLSVGGDHSMTLPILKAIGRDRPVGMIHID